MDIIKTHKLSDGNEMTSLERIDGKRTITVCVTGERINVFVATGRRMGSGRIFAGVAAAIAAFKLDAVKSAILDAAAACESN